MNLLAAGAGTLSAAFFAIGTLRQSDRTIFEIAGTYYDVNKHLAEALSEQRAEYAVGAFLLLATFLLQVSANIVPPTLQPSFLQSEWMAIGVASAVLAACAVVARVTCHRLSAQMKARVAALIEKDIAESQKK